MSTPKETFQKGDLVAIVSRHLGGEVINPNVFPGEALVKVAIIDPMTRVTGITHTVVPHSDLKKIEKKTGVIVI